MVRTTEKKWIIQVWNGGWKKIDRRLFSTQLEAYKKMYLDYQGYEIAQLRVVKV